MLRKRVRSRGDHHGRRGGPHELLNDDAQCDDDTPQVVIYISRVYYGGGSEFGLQKSSKIDANSASSANSVRRREAKKANKNGDAAINAASPPIF
jgi:hypothetical protein